MSRTMDKRPLTKSLGVDSQVMEKQESIRGEQGYLGSISAALGGRRCSLYLKYSCASRPPPAPARDNTNCLSHLFITAPCRLVRRGYGLSLAFAELSVVNVSAVRAQILATNVRRS